MIRALGVVRLMILAVAGFTLPLEYTGFAAGPVRFTPNKVVTALLLVLVAAQFALERRRFVWSTKHLWVGALLGAASISTVQSFLLGYGNAVRALGTWYALAAFYFLLVYLVKERRELDLLLGSFAAGCLFAVGSGLIGWGIVTDTRLGGEGASPNLLAFNLLIAIAAAASLALTSRSSLQRLPLFALAGFLVLGLVLSLSRSGYVAFTLMACLWLYRFGRVDSLRYALPFAAILVLAVVFAPESAVERAQTLSPDQIGRSDTSAAGRIQMIPGAFKAFASNPVTGVGLDRYIRWAIEQKDVHVAGIHSAYLRVLAESGLVGFVPFAAVLALSWREFARATRLAHRLRGRRDRELRILEVRATTLQIAFAGTLVMGLAQPSNQHKGLWMMVAVSLVMLDLVRRRVAVIADAPDEAVVEQPVWSFSPPTPRANAPQSVGPPG
jgi:O-antigen ligase